MCILDPKSHENLNKNLFRPCGRLPCRIGQDKRLRLHRAYAEGIDSTNRQSGSTPSLQRHTKSRPCAAVNFRKR